MIFSRLFHQYIRTQELDIPRDRSLWPPEWKEVDFKQYKRFPEIFLPEPSLPATSLETALQRRTSARVFDADTKCTLTELSTILHYGFGIKSTVQELRTSSAQELTQSRRYYPSGGARYPLEVYVFVQAIAGVDQGVYHYDVAHHSLRFLGSNELLQEITPSLHKETQTPQFVLLVTAKQGRNAIKYSDHGYDMIGLECGHATQNALLAGAALKKKSFCFFGYDITALANQLQLDDDELIFYALMFG